jgi:hypothetical protein
MEYTITINLFYILGLAFFAVLMYVYIKDDGDDRLTHIRHDIEMKKEWFRMLAEQNKQKAKSEAWKNKRA